VLAFVAFFCVVVGAIIVSRGLRALTRWSQVVTPLMVLTWAAVIPLLLLGHRHLRRHSLGGLCEKVFLGIELLWLLAAALAAARYREPSPEFRRRRARSARGRRLCRVWKASR
jgi:hypothetical protein